jgi:hypothetical protein
MKTIKEKKLKVALLKEKLERISGKKITFDKKENMKTIKVSFKKGILIRENILVPRKLDNRDEKYKQKIYKLLQQKVYDGDLDLSDLPFELEDLGKLEKVNGYLDLTNTSIKSLGKLEKVNGYLSLENTSIKSLGNLEKVIGSLHLVNTPINSLGKLQYVKGNLDLTNTSIKSLGKLKEVNGYLDLCDTSIKSLGNLEKVNDFLNLRNTPITDLGKLEKVGSQVLENQEEISSLGNKIFISTDQEKKTKGLKNFDYLAW